MLKHLLSIIILTISFSVLAKNEPIEKPNNSALEDEWLAPLESIRESFEEETGLDLLDIDDETTLDYIIENASRLGKIKAMKEILFHIETPATCEGELYCTIDAYEKEIQKTNDRPHKDVLQAVIAELKQKEEKFKEYAEKCKHPDQKTLAVVGSRCVLNYADNIRKDYDAFFKDDGKVVIAELQGCILKSLTKFAEEDNLFAMKALAKLSTEKKDTAETEKWLNKLHGHKDYNANKEMIEFCSDFEM